MNYKELIQSDQIIHKSIKSKLSEKILTVSLPACYEDHIDFSFHQKKGFTEHDLYDSFGWLFPNWAFSPITENSVDCSPEINEIKNGRKGHNGIFVKVNTFFMRDEEGKIKKAQQEEFEFGKFVAEKNNIRLYDRDGSISFYLSNLKENNKHPIKIVFDDFNTSSYDWLHQATIETIIYNEFRLEYQVWASNMKKNDNPYSLLENNNPKDSNTVEKMISILKTSKSNEELLNHPELFLELVDNNEKVVKFFESHSVIK